jgi:macrolide-specific efflux system membrane fusion protein
MTLTDLSQLTISCDIAEADIGEVSVGQPANVTLNALSGQTFAAVVSAVGNTGSTSSDVVTFPVTLTLTNPTSSVRIGMSASVSIITQQLDNVLVVPSSAVSGSGKTGTVTAESSSGTQTRVPVVIGLAGTSTTGVYGNLTVGEKVVLPTVTISSSGGATSSGGLGSGGFGSGSGGLGRLFSGGGGGFSGGGFSFRGAGG